MRRANHAQGRRRGTGKEWYVALVGEQRQHHRRADLGGSVSRREHEGSAHDVRPAAAGTRFEGVAPLRSAGGTLPFHPSPQGTSIMTSTTEFRAMPPPAAT